VHGRTILIVEDNEQNMELASFLLEEAGVDVRQATNPEEAHTQMQKGTPDLVLMDMSLGGTDGLSLVGEIRGKYGAGFPILALTAHAMRGDKERFLAGGCDGYISKPINTKTFVTEVRGYLEAQGGAA